MPAAPQQPPPLVLASLAAVTGNSDQVDESTRVPVHFNPASLQLAVSNELKDTKNNERKQYIAKTSAKLTMDLIFDTTETGADVTRITRKLQGFLVPTPPPGKKPPREVPPPLVLFEWGALKFKGIAESYKETIDFFSPEGVPLRSGVNLTLSRQDKVFDDTPGANAPAADRGSADDSLALSGNASPAAAAAGGGAPGAARAIAAGNNLESLRFGAGAGLVVSGGVQLKAAAAFSAGASAGAGGSAGVSLGGGLSVGGGASLGLGGPVGLSARAGLSATEGAFAGLGTGAAIGVSASLDPARLRTDLPGAKLAVDANAAFGRDGSSSSDTPAGLRADVGANAPLKLKLTFD